MEKAAGIGELRGGRTSRRLASRLAELRGPWVASLAVAVVVLAGASRLLISRRWYYWDDTQNGAYGQWYEFGSMLLNGSVRLLDPSAWQAGNYLAEGQWGLFSPLTALLAIGTHAVGSASAYVALVKILLLGVFALGIYLLARSFQAAPWWAAVAATAAPLAGFTLYMDAASWVTGLINAALLPWVWWGLRRLVYDRRGPLVYLIATYLLVSAGYIFGVLVLVVLLVATLIEQWGVGGWRSTIPVVLASLFGGAVTVAIFLPGLLTAPVTVRSDNGILNDGFLNADLSDLAASPLATGLVTINGYWGDVAPAPVQYIAWFLPLFPLVWSRGAFRGRGVWPLVAVTGVMLAMVLGPSEVGPLRYFIRMMPYVTTGVVVLFAIFASDRATQRSFRARALASLALATIAGFLTWAQYPLNWNAVLFAGGTVVLGVLIVVVIAARARLSPHRLPALAAPVVILVGLVALNQQAGVAPTSPLGQFNSPSSIDQMSKVLADVPDDVLVVGDVYSLGGKNKAYEETLLANLWYVSHRNVINVYTVLPHKAFTRDLCIDLRGRTCEELFDKLLEEDPTTDMPLVDLLGVNTVQVIVDRQQSETLRMPTGWSVHDRGQWTTTFVRDSPVSTAGSIAWTSPGSEVERVAQSDTSVSFRVDRVAADGGTVVFKRLAWPGYTVSGSATLSDPTRGYLLTVELAPGAEGSVVTVSFLPPGWWLCMGALGAALALGIVWLVLAFRRRRLRDVDESPSEPELVLESSAS